MWILFHFHILQSSYITASALLFFWSRPNSQNICTSVPPSTISPRAQNCFFTFTRFLLFKLEQSQLFAEYPVKNAGKISHHFTIGLFSIGKNNKCLAVIAKQSQPTWVWVYGNNYIVNSTILSYGQKGVAAATNNPGGRSYPASWSVTSGFYMFGGATNAGYFSDTWLYDRNTGFWTWVAGSNQTGMPGVYGNLGVPSAANYPGGRYRPFFWADTSNNMWLYGGGWATTVGVCSQASKCPAWDDLWKFNGTMWTWMGGSSTQNVVAVKGGSGVYSATFTPGARFGGNLWFSQGSTFVFGGFSQLSSSGLEHTNDLWRFNGSMWSFIRTGTASFGSKGVTSFANNPPERYAAASWFDGTTFWLFGGFGAGAVQFNDMWKLDSSFNWTWVAGANTDNDSGNYGTRGVASTDNSPPARHGGYVWVDVNKQLWLFGGQTNLISGLYHSLLLTIRGAL